MNKTQVLGWDTYWNLPHLPDLTGSSPCPYRAGGTKGAGLHPPHKSTNFVTSNFNMYAPLFSCPLLSSKLDSPVIKILESGFF